MLRRSFVVLAALVVLALPGRAAADRFCCGVQGPPLVADFARAEAVILGRFENAVRGEGVESGTTDLVLESVLKSPRSLEGKQRIKVPRYLPAAKGKYLVFCDSLRNDALLPYRVVEGPSKELLDYFQGALKLKDRPLPERLRYAFDYLNNPDMELAQDAFREYAGASYAEYQAMAKKLPADTLAGWLRDDKTPPYRYGLFALLLGECGTEKHAPALRAILDEPKKRPQDGVDGVLAGYLMLRPAEAWKYVCGMLGDPKGDFVLRYSAIRTVRFLWDQRPDLIGRDELVRGAALVLEHADQADFVIEDLRKWKRWELCGRVLDLLKRDSHNVGVIQRAVLRYALQCPEPAAVAYVRDLRRRDPEAVTDAEEILKLESETARADPKGK